MRTFGSSNSNCEPRARYLSTNGLVGIVTGKVHKRYEFGVKPKHVYADLGYRSHDYKGDCDVQIVNRFRQSKSRSLLRWWKRRSAIEPVIGHVKSDNYMERNRLAGTQGDKLCVILAAVFSDLTQDPKKPG